MLIIYSQTPKICKICLQSGPRGGLSPVKYLVSTLDTFDQHQPKINSQKNLFNLYRQKGKKPYIEFFI